MGRGVNKVIIVGNVGQDPEVRYSPSGTMFAEISVATSISWKDKNTGVMQEHTEWTRVAFSGRMAEIASEYLKKGSKVYCEGRLHTNSWEGANNVKQYKTVVRCSEMQMLDNRDFSSSNANQNNSQQSVPNKQSDSSNARPSNHESHPQQPVSSGLGGGAFSGFDDDIPFIKLHYAEGG